EGTPELLQGKDRHSASSRHEPRSGMRSWRAPRARSSNLTRGVTPILRQALASFELWLALLTHGRKPFAYILRLARVEMRGECRPLLDIRARKIVHALLSAPL